jgi:hypothetical protein
MPQYLGSNLRQENERSMADFGTILDESVAFIGK